MMFAAWVRSPHGSSLFTLTSGDGASAPATSDGLRTRRPNNWMFGAWILRDPSLSPRVTGR